MSCWRPARYLGLQARLLYHKDGKSLFSMSEANQNFSRIAREVDEKGTAVILKNNVPRYLIIDFSQAESAQAAEDEDVMEISKRLIQKNRAAYEVLAK